MEIKKELYELLLLSFNLKMYVLTKYNDTLSLNIIAHYDSFCRSKSFLD